MKRYLFTLFIILHSLLALSQQINLETVGSTLKNKPFKINGGLSAGSVFYQGTVQTNRLPWTYYLNGNVNLSIYDLINIPVSVNFTNLGADLSYPSLPNRLSLHPSYKWVTAHIGDVSMTFSPYTLNGHQFTGGGIELTPGKLKISAMGGRLMREVKLDSANLLMPNYSRIGYGLNAQYEGKNYRIGATYFGGKDILNESMQFYMDSLSILPMQNNVFSIQSTLNLVKNLSFSIEYAISLLTRDIRSEQQSTWMGNILGLRTSTNAYHATNAKLAYQLMKNSIAIAYERIDPEYKTLGAYYFNNDYENITLNYARPFLKNDKANVALSVGIQKDDIENKKSESTNRYVASINLNYNPSEAFQTSFNYSTFQSYRNLKSQFDYINELNPYENMDTLNYTQLSQNLDASMSYIFKTTETQNQRINLNASYQTAADQQGGISLPGNVNRFLNTALGYNLSLVPKSFSLMSSINVSYNYGAMIESYTFGPMLGLTKQFFEKTLTTGISSSYNINRSAGIINAKVLNLRCNASYRLKKKHNFTTSAVWQNRNTTKINTDALTLTVAYSYSF